VLCLNQPTGLGRNAMDVRATVEQLEAYVCALLALMLDLHQPTGKMKYRSGTNLRETCY